ncbi:MAG TPA: VTT domain-containing protein [Lacunisphaera sp.]|nr:VTT domain-containing protein [Lacunisphaera sp.]
MTFPPATDRAVRNRRRLLGALLAVLLAGLAVLVGRGGVLQAAETAVLALREAGPAVFFLAMAVLPAAGFPLMPFTLAAGPVFGPLLGPGTVILCCVAAVVANLLLTYWLAARALRPLTIRVLDYFAIRLPADLTVGTWELTLLVRLTPGPPFWLQSYLLGVLRMPLLPYLVISTGVIAGYLVVLVYGGQALMQGQGRTALLAAAGLGVLAAMFQLARRLVARRKPLPPAHALSAK